MDSEAKCPIFCGNIAELNGLRAFAATQVVLVHTWPASYPLASLFQSSWFFLDVFFVLSGFLIGGILLDSRGREDYYQSFYLRRALRICPLYYLLIAGLTILVLTSAQHHGAEMARHWGSPWWFFVFLGNIPTAITGTWPLRAYAHLWSIQVEQQFYLLFPILVRRLELATLKRVLWVLVFVSPVLRIVIYFWDPGNTTAQYVLLPCRMESFAFGALMAIRFREGPWKIPRRRLTISTTIWVSATLLLSIWAGTDGTGPFNRTIGYLMSSVASAHIVLWLICYQGSRATALLRLAPVQHVGRIGYGVYLLHLPIASYVSAALHAPRLDYGIPHVLAVFFLTLVCASVSWRVLESPLINLGKRFATRRSRPLSQLKLASSSWQARNQEPM